MWLTKHCYIGESLEVGNTEERPWLIYIEVYGDYWHVNPNIYDVLGNDVSKKTINEQQEAFIPRDKKKEDDFIMRDLDYRIIWESEVHENVNLYMNEILNKESVTTTRNAPINIGWRYSLNCIYNLKENAEGRS